MTKASEDEDDAPRAKGLDISKLKIGGIPKPKMNDALRRAMEEMDRRMPPFEEMQKKLAQTEGFSAAQEAMERSLGPFRDIQDRMKNLGLAAGANSALGRLSEQIAAQQHAIDAMRLPEPELPRIPEVPPMPPNPILETNRRLERIEERFEQMQGIAADAALIATGLQASAAEFLQKFEKAAADNDRTAGRAIWIGVVAVIIAVAMPAAQIIYSEYHRVPSKGLEIQVALEEVQAELSAMRDAQASASDRLRETLASADDDTAAILRDIRGLLSERATTPVPVAGKPQR